MANGQLLTLSGKQIGINRIFKETPDYTAPYYFKVGIGTTTPSVADTDLVNIIPITNGTVNDDGSTNFTGTSGGDNSTDNTSTYKEGAGAADATAQNLIANGTNASKIWTLTPLGSSVVGTKPFSLWLYIKDATALAKFKSSGTAFEVRFRTNGDGATLFYSQTTTAAELSTGWNYITSGTTNVNALTAGGGGAPSGTINEFVMIITTNLATDTFVAGDVVYDLLRQWAGSDLLKTFVSGYPILDEPNTNSTIRTILLTTEANGFPITEFGVFNNDGTPKNFSRSVFTAISKTSGVQIIFVEKDKIT